VSDYVNAGWIIVPVIGRHEIASERTEELNTEKERLVDGKVTAKNVEE
jgi:hypothetical protein